LSKRHFSRIPHGGKRPEITALERRLRDPGARRGGGNLPAENFTKKRARRGALSPAGKMGG